MTMFESFHRSSRMAPELHADLSRTALAVALFLLIGLGLSLAATQPGSPLATTPVAGEVWHGNAAASGWTR